MQTATTKPLLVLNASAGSGKTYNLVRNYLRLLLSEGDQKAELGEIIAMTFTNKASLEMKTRIVSDLSKLAHGNADSASYLQDIADFCQSTPTKIRNNARVVLKKMLHQYEDFNVLTIDKFNLKLIRSFSRDLNLPEHFEVVLDEQMILEKAVDELLNTIDAKEKNRIYQLAINYAKSNLEEEDKWNVKTALLKSAEILKNEQSFGILKALTAAEFTTADLDLWKLQLKQLLTTLVEAQKTAWIAFEKSGLETIQYTNKNNTESRIVKMANAKTNFPNLADAFEWPKSFIPNLTKTAEKYNQPELLEKVIVLTNFWTDHKDELHLLFIKTQQFYLLSILRELALSMESIREKEGVIRISEFNKLVAELVKEEEAPFIYERLGTRFNHFFLDEFQDTSRLQWTNLIPLIHESLSHGHFNFIVGDPKQSIYRFKNGVAEQFVALPRIYNPENDAVLEEKSDYFEEMGDVEGLKDNWRSSKNIVTFNNQLFTHIQSTLPLSGQAHYNQIIQHPKGKAEGLIVYQLENLVDENNLKCLQFLENAVNECMEDGYHPGDICILSKRKKECNNYANFLKSKGFSIVSSDSLLVDSDLTVQQIISFLKWRTNPQELQYAMHFAELRFRRLHPTNSYANYALCFESIQTDRGEKSVFRPSRFFEISGFDPNLLEVGYQNLYALIQLYLRSEGIDELKNAYVHQLLDMAFQFDLNHGPDLLAFLSYYKERGKEINVQLPENKNSIKIMTSHKSKGLEFPVVIIPSIQFESSSNMKKNQIVATDDHFMETNLSKMDANLDFIAPLKEMEEEAIVMDGINLLYVAFTRPIDRLYFFGAKNKKTDKIRTSLFQFLAAEMPENKTENGIVGRIGQKPIRTEEKDSQTSLFKASSLQCFLWFPYISIQSKEE
jgi:ATP-dependent exoDNAse (exonuclease V) beta subunit